jgi:hypothetical protein
MAEENLIIITTADPEPYMTATLVAKSDPQAVARVMAMPGHHTTLFTLAGARPVGGDWLAGYKGKTFHLTRWSSRKPYQQLEGLETLLRTWWLGVAPETIEENINQITDMMNVLKEQALTVRRLSEQMPKLRQDDVGEETPAEEQEDLKVDDQQPNQKGL